MSSNSKAKQLKKDKPIDRCLSANLSPPEQTVVKELNVCVDARNYSWQVAPLQSLLPLHSGKTNIARLISKQV